MSGEGIEVEVYRHDAPKVYVDTLQARLEPNALDELTGNGGGQVKINVNDPKILEDPTLLDYRNILKTKINGKIVAAIMITHKKTITIGEGEKSEEYYEITGESLKIWFDDADVKPYGGLKVDSPDTRSFSFASERGEWYDASKWLDPVVIAPYGGGIWVDRPENWPINSNAKWIWGEALNAGGNSPDNSVCLFRYEFNVALGGNYVFYLAADNYLDAYIDGQQVVTTDAKASAYAEATKVEIYLTPGDHVMAMKVRNESQATGNPAAALAAIYRMEGDVETWVGASGGMGWKSLKYPAVMPGWSPGEIMVTLLNEAKARGVLFPSHLTPSFTTTHDSNNVPWGNALDWTFDIGEPLSSVVSKFEELGCYIWINPDTLQLNMSYSRGVDRSIFGYGADGITVTSTPIIFEQGKNLRKAESEGAGKIKNSLTIKTEVGWLIADNKDVPSTTKYGTLESQLDTGASEAISKSLAAVVFDQKAQAEEGATYEVIIRPEDEAIPFVHFFVGDWVMAPNDRRELVKRRVMSISVSENENGRVHYAIEFDTIFQDREARINKLMSGGGVGGSYSNAGGSGTFTNSPIIIGGTGPAPARLPMMPAGLNATSVGHWEVNGMTTYSLVTLDWNPVTANTDGTATIPSHYEVWGKLASETDEAYMMHSIATSNSAILRLSPAPSDWVFKVRAVNVGEQYSAYSNPLTHTAKGPTAAMPAPKPPTLTSDKGVLIINWGGLLVGDIAPPPQFRYIYATIATTETGIYSRMGATIQRDGRSISIPGLVVGTTYWVKLVGVDGANIATDPSTAASIVITGISLGTLEQDVSDAIADAKKAGTDAGSVASGAQSIANEANAAAESAQGTANTALSAANGKNKIIFSTADASSTGAEGYIEGDVWYKKLGSLIVGQWEFTTSWQPRVLDNAAIANLDAGKITSGFIAADRIATNSLSIGKVSGLQVELNDKTSLDYIASRGTDLVTNGTGLLKNNTNFSSLTFDADAPMGAAGSFDGLNPRNIFSDEIIPIDTSRKYLFRFKARQKNANMPATRFYSGLVPYDADGLPISPSHYAHFAASMTTLAAALNPGETTITLTSATNWGVANANMYAGLWNYVDGSGRVWPPGTYTRNAPNVSSISGNVLTLSSPYAGPALPIGHPVSRNQSAGSYMYVGAVNSVMPLSWTEFSGFVGGLLNASNGAGAVDSFPPGAAGVKLMFLLTYANTGAVTGQVSRQALASLSFSDATAALLDAAAAQSTANTANSTANAANTLVQGWRTTGQTTIDGGKITADSVKAAQIASYAVTAQKIAIADFSSLATINEVLGTTVTSYGQTKIVNGWNELVNDTGTHFMFKDQNGPLPFKEGDELFIEFNIMATTEYNANVGVWLYGATTVTTLSPTIAVTTTEQIVTTSIKLPSTFPANVATWVIGLHGVASKGTKIRKVTVRRMHQGELIVDGAITSTKIRAGEVTAGKLAAQSVVSENLQAGAVTAGKIAAGAITAKEILAGSITGNELKVGAIEARHIAAGVGGQLDISANTSVNLLVGQVNDVQADADATQANLAQMQTYYNFGTDGAVIGKPGSPFTLALRSDRIEMLENGNVVSYWNSGQMHVSDFVGERVILGNHQLEKYGTSTVVRKL